ncbi:hypothetical protein [Streptomyces zaomyceticus]|uniref:hypothetical protein n=1 Tax=Streptomyces zaomyceticus TaxID=68286 RepID=UPI0033A190D7
MNTGHSAAEVVVDVAAFSSDVMGNFLGSILATATGYLARRLYVRRQTRRRVQEEAAEE